MEQENSPLTPEGRVGSEDPLVEPTGPTRNSNGRALKIAAITTLFCVLVSAQAFTAYMVFDQRAQIHDLQKNQINLQAEMSRTPRVRPQKMVFPFPSSPFMNVIDGLFDTPATTTARPSVEEELQAFIKDVELPHFNKSFLDNLQNLREKVDETSWKGFVSWLRYWLIFQMAEKTATPHLVKRNPAPKCQKEANAGNRGFGSFRPQCDEQGNYKSKQCWASTGQCWCVDENGVRISHSNRGRHMDCDKVRSSRTSRDSVMMPAISGLP